MLPYFSYVKNFKKCPKSSTFLVWKLHKGAGIFENPKTFLNKGTEHKQNYMESLNSKNKNTKGGELP